MASLPLAVAARCRRDRPAGTSGELARPTWGDSGLAIACYLCRAGGRYLRWCHARSLLLLLSENVNTAFAHALTRASWEPGAASSSVANSSRTRNVGGDRSVSVAICLCIIVVINCLRFEARSR